MQVEQPLDMLQIMMLLLLHIMISIIVAVMHLLILIREILKSMLILEKIYTSELIQNDFFI